MKRIEALKEATKIARMISEAIAEVRRPPAIAELLAIPLRILQPDTVAKEKLNFDDTFPRVFEILIFGEVAETSSKGDYEEVGNIDMVVVGNKVISDLYDWEDWREEPSANLELLLSWFGREGVINDVTTKNVYLHVFPVQMLEDTEVRKEIQDKYEYPEFLWDCFQHVLRYDGVQDKFSKVDIAYFEEKYHTRLDDLKKA